jgi:hypothetical protein
MLYLRVKADRRLRLTALKSLNLLLEYVNGG